MSEPKFNPIKTTQAAARFLELSGGSLEKYILIKLLYLLDRQSIRLWNDVFTGDRVVSMEHGPVLSRVYDLTKGEALLHRSYWERFISDADQETFAVTLKASPGRDEISDNELELIDTLHKKFAAFTLRQMREHCHQLPEYEEVGKTSKPMAMERLLKALGRTPAEMEQFQKDQIEARMLAALLE